ncbi:MAG TPA: DUF1707 and FHA domain-containing protein [Actinocrinis sp.]|nr:DUF1707 and FHA domain-containing protein [Actinocrinis sp.]
MTTLEFLIPAARASDADRDRAIDALRAGAVDGLISHDTFLLRMDAALAARRRGELGYLTADLPGTDVPGSRPAPPPQEGRLVRWTVEKVSRAARFRNQVRAAWRMPDLPRLRLPEPMPFPLRIGRAEGCELGLPHDSVSRRHAEIYHRNGVWLLRDLSSTNGTRVNGRRITSDVIVQPGDVVSFGNLNFRLSASR